MSKNISLKSDSDSPEKNPHKFKNLDKMLELDNTDSNLSSHSVTSLLNFQET